LLDELLVDNAVEVEANRVANLGRQQVAHPSHCRLGGPTANRQNLGRRHSRTGDIQAYLVGGLGLGRSQRDACACQYSERPPKQAVLIPPLRIEIFIVAP
jgi:hypothetical protein